MKKSISIPLELHGHKLRIGFQVTPNGRRDWLTRRNERMVREFARGYSVQRLAKKYNLTENRISQVLIASGARQPKWRKMSEKARWTIFQLQKIGLSKAEIGRQIGVSRERVRQILHQGYMSR